MKPRIIYNSAALFLAIIITACATAKAPVKTGGGPQTVKDISTIDYPEKVDVILEADQPLMYTTFRLTDPDRLIVDLTGVTFGQYKEEIEIDKGALKTILPVEGEEPNHIARLELKLTSAVESRVYTEGNKLIISLEKPATVTEAAGEIITPAETGEAAPMAPVSPPVIEEKPLPQEEPISPAKVVSKVTVQPNENTITVTITGDGELKPQVSMVEGNRLVVDLPEVTSTVSPNVINVKHAVLKKVRIGQHVSPQKVRVVLDLTRPVTYDVQSSNQETRVIVQATSQPAPAVPPPPMVSKEEEPPAKPAPKKAPPKETASVNSRTELEQPQGPMIAKKYTGKRVSLDFQDADIENVLRLLADVSGLNIVIGQEVQGKVTIKLINVPWDQALDIILKMNNLGQIREGNIIRIASLANIARQQAEEAAAKEAKVKAEDLVTRILPVNYAKAEDLAEPLRKNLSPRGDITIDKRTNTMIIKDVERHLQDILSLARTLDTRTPQVQIEARIVSADTTFARDLGVIWGATFDAVSGNNVFGVTTGPKGGSPLAPTPGFAVNLPASGVAGTVGDVGFTFGRFTDTPFNLDLRLSAGEKMGLSKTISAPKVSVLDNQEAKIEQGTSIPFQTVSQQGTQTTFIDANLILQVTPHVTADGTILMKVKVADNSPDFANTTAAGPPIKKKEASTQLLVKDGETTVIGGIYVNTKSDTESGVPLLSKIPVLGWLFKNQSKSDTTNELLLFLTPRIIQ
jgi:type IV pilus assembly protein PilQ